MNIILASTSTYRKALLQKLQLPFECASPCSAENRIAGEHAKDMVIRLAQQKAREIARQYNEGLIIGSDQAAVIDENILGKPGNVQTAKKQLAMCSGKTVQFYTGLYLYNAANGESRQLVEQFDVSFRTLNDNQIEQYINKEMPLDCAGSFKSEGLGIALFSAMHGRDPNSLIGLPLIGLCDLLAEFGIDPLI